MKTKNLDFILNINIILLISMSIKEIKSIRCGADKLKIKPGILNITKINSKRKLDIEYTPIKIKVDFSSFEKPNSMSEQNYKFIKDLIEDTVKEFYKFLKVQHNNIDLKGQESIIKSNCMLNKIDSNYERFLIDNDVLIFPIFNSELGNNILAAAGICLTEDNYKPIMGILYIAPNIYVNKTNTNLFMKYLFLHEISHILIFNPEVFGKLGMITKKTIDGIEVTYINSPNVLDKAKQHFNCNSLIGIPLEDQGGIGSSGSHWEARYMLGDYMISTFYMDTILSDISLALFEDSGFYKVEYYSGGLFKFGKNKGCDFLNKKCLLDEKTLFNEEFCDSQYQPMCTSSRTAKGQCLIYDYKSMEIPSKYQYFSNPNHGGFQPANFCPVTAVTTLLKEKDYYPTSCNSGTIFSNINGEEIGENSFCFISSLLPKSSNRNINLMPICYKVECNKNINSIIVHIGSLTVNCPTFGGIIKNPYGFKGEIVCPKYYDICNFDSDNICNEMFNCLNKRVKADENSYSSEINRIIIHKVNSSFNNKYNFYAFFIIIIFLYINI